MMRIRVTRSKPAAASPAAVRRGAVPSSKPRPRKLRRTNGRRNVRKWPLTPLAIPIFLVATGLVALALVGFFGRSILSIPTPRPMTPHAESETDRALAAAVAAVFAERPAGPGDAALLSALYAATADALDSPAGRQLVTRRIHVEALVLATGSLGKDFQVAKRYPKLAQLLEAELRKTLPATQGPLSNEERAAVVTTYRRFERACAKT